MSDASQSPVFSRRDREIAALAAAVASNCVSCVEHHVPESRTAGLSDAEINEIVELADAVRTVSGRNAVNAAAKALSAPVSVAAEAADCASLRRACC
jgi:AhpD family alkylhydroperoxidase